MDFLIDFFCSQHIVPQILSFHELFKQVAFACYLSFLSKSDLSDFFSKLHKNSGFICLEFVKTFGEHMQFLSKIRFIVHSPRC